MKKPTSISYELRFNDRTVICKTVKQLLNRVRRFYNENQIDFDIVKITTGKSYKTQKDFLTNEPIPYFIGDLNATK